MVRQQTEWFDLIRSKIEATLIAEVEGYTDIDCDELSTEQVAEMRGHLRRAILAIGLCPMGCDEQ
jgi:hypothetical protein